MVEARTGIWWMDPKTGELIEYVGSHKRVDVHESGPPGKSLGWNLHPNLSDLSEFPTGDQYLPTGRVDFSQ